MFYHLNDNFNDILTINKMNFNQEINWYDCFISVKIIYFIYESFINDFSLINEHKNNQEQNFYIQMFDLVCSKLNI
jgi:hypothetical protein